MIAILLGILQAVFCEGALNPYESGCLRQRLPDDFVRLRTCNSDDPPGAAERGICRPSASDYMELRIFSQNWESVFFVTWVLQILLSELLDVPTSVETGTPDARIGFYDSDAPFDYGTSLDLESLSRAAELVDCRLANRDPAAYDYCAHFVPETWAANEAGVVERVRNGVIEVPQAMGVVGQEGW